MINIKKKFAIIEPEIEDYVPIIYQDIIKTLKKIGVSYRFYRVRKKIKKKRHRYLKYPVLSQKVLENANLLIVYSPYATSHKAKQWSKKHKVPLLHLEHGFLPKSSLCDIDGFWGDSKLKNNIQVILKPYLNQECQQWSENYSQYLISNNISKRKQLGSHTLVNGEFVFLPMQYMEDQSVIKFGNIPYQKFVDQVASFCSDNNLILAIKKHPHAYFKEKKSVDRLLKKMKAKYGKIISIVDGSIHWFCQNCCFMAGMNTGSIIDGLVNNTIISHCGESIFMNSGAVIHDNNVRNGLYKCLNMRDKTYITYQKALLYYLYNYYLLLTDDTHCSKLSNVDKIINQIKGTL